MSGNRHTRVFCSSQKKVSEVLLLSRNRRAGFLLTLSFFHMCHDLTDTGYLHILTGFHSAPPVPDLANPYSSYTYQVKDYFSQEVFPECFTSFLTPRLRERQPYVVLSQNQVHYLLCHLYHLMGLLVQQYDCPSIKVKTISMVY